MPSRSQRYAQCRPAWSRLVLSRSASLDWCRGTESWRRTALFLPVLRLPRADSMIGDSHCRRPCVYTSPLLHLSPSSYRSCSLQRFEQPVPIRQDGWSSAISPGGSLRHQRLVCALIPRTNVSLVASTSDMERPGSHSRVRAREILLLLALQSLKVSPPHQLLDVMHKTFWILATSFPAAQSGLLLLWLPHRTLPWILCLLKVIGSVICGSCR